MRTKLVFIVVIVGWLMISSIGNSQPMTIEQTLSEARLQELSSPIYSKQELRAGASRILVLTRDYGSGLELRDASIYVWDESLWRLISYVKTRSASVDAQVNGHVVELKSDSKTVVLSVPVELLSLP